MAAQTISATLDSVLSQTFRDYEIIVVNDGSPDSREMEQTLAPYVASRVEQIRDGVERGETILRTSSTTGVFTPVALQMIAVGEESGEMDKLMDEIAEMYEREVQYEIKTLSARIEPIMIVAMAILVLILALGVFMPMWSMGRTMRAH